MIYSRIPSVSLVISSKERVIPEKALPNEILVAPVITGGVPIDYLIRTVKAQILVRSPVDPMIPGIPLVVSDETQIVSGVAITVMILIVLLEAPKAAVAPPPSSVRSSYLRGRRGHTRRRGERGQGHPWQKEQNKQGTQTDKA